MVRLRSALTIFAIGVLISFDIEASRVVIARYDGPTCPAEFAKLKISPEMHRRGLALGDEVELKLPGEKQPVRTVYLGTVNGPNGREDILAELGILVTRRYRVQSDAAVWRVDGSRKDLPEAPAGRWVLESKENVDGTCAAHAASSCIVEFDPELVAKVSSGATAEADVQRNQIYERAKQVLYGKGQSDKEVDEFLSEYGLSAKTEVSGLSGASDAAWNHLKSGKPVILGYESESQFVHQSDELISPSGVSPMPSKSVVKAPNPSYRDYPISSHAVLALTAIDSPRFGKMVLIQDSSGGGLRLLEWRQLQGHNYASPTRFHLIDVRATSVPAISTRELPPDFLSDAKRSTRSQVSDALETKPSNFHRVNQTEFSERLFSDSAVGSWVVVRRKTDYVGKGNSLVTTGKIVRTGAAERGQRYFVISHQSEPYSFSKPEEFLWEMELDSVYVNRVPTVSDAATKSKIEKETATKLSSFSPIADWTQKFSDLNLGDEVAIRFQRNVGDKPEVVDGRIVQKTTGGSGRNGKIGVFDIRRNSVVTFDPRDLISAAYVRPLKRSQDAEPAIRASLVEEFAKRFERSNVLIGSSIRRNVDSVRAILPVPGMEKPKFDLDELKGRPLLLKLADGLQFRNENLHAGRMGSGNSENIIFEAEFGGPFNLPIEQVGGLLGYEPATRTLSTLPDILARSSTPTYMYAKTGDHKRVVASLKGAKPVKGKEAYQKLLKDASIGDPIAVEYRRGLADESEYSAGRVIAKQPGGLTVWNESSGEAVELTPDTMVSSVFAKPGGFKWSHIELTPVEISNAAKSGEKVAELARKTAKGFALVTTDRIVGIYGKLNWIKTNDGFELQVTDMKGEVHKISSSKLKALKVSSTSETPETRELFYFPSE